MTEYVVVYPNQLAVEAVKSNTLFIAYNPTTGKMIGILGNSNGYPMWNAEDEYDEDAIVIYQLRFWKSLIDDNVGIIPTEGASWTEVSPDELGTGVVDHFRGNYDASTNLFPAAGLGSGVDGAIQPGDEWVFTVGGTFNDNFYPAGTIAKALSVTPGQTFSNWRLI